MQSLKYLDTVCATALLLALGACGHMTRRQENTALGADIGAAATGRGVAQVCC